MSLPDSGSAYERWLEEARQVGGAPRQARRPVSPQPGDRTDLTEPLMLLAARSAPAPPELGEVETAPAKVLTRASLFDHGSLPAVVFPDHSCDARLKSERKGPLSATKLPEVTDFEFREVHDERRTSFSSDPGACHPAGCNKETTYQTTERGYTRKWETAT